MAKYIIRFMPEYHSTSLWPVSDNAYSDLGIPIEYKTVGLSDLLMNRLENFDDSILGIIDWNNPAGDSPLNKEERECIYQEGLKLLQMVRNEISSDYEVIDNLDWIKPE